MPRAPRPLWANRKEPVMDDYIHASVNAVNGVFDPQTGFYAKLVYSGCATEQRAQEISSALYRCAGYINTHKIAPVAVKTWIKQADDGTYNVEYVVINKKYTYAYMVSHYGEDRSKWPYNPRKKGS